MPNLRNLIQIITANFNSLDNINIGTLFNKVILIMRHQKRLNDEIALVKSKILTMLSRSAHPSHQQLISILSHTANNEWLDLAAEKLGPEYEAHIERMTKLEAAISQIEIGQYGYCCDCEEKISDQRLEQDPASQRCEKCAH